MTLVVDTSVIIKWFVNEDGHREAVKLLETSEQLVCPDLALIEATNVLWRKTRGNEISLAQAKAAAEKMPGFFDEIIPCSSHIADTFSLAEKLEHSVYDCLFLALACQSTASYLITGDAKFTQKCVNAGFADKVRLLQDKPVFVEFSEKQIKKLLDLLENYERTKEFVKQSTFGGKKGSITMADMMPAFDSPTYKTLESKIGQLDNNDKSSIVAISWYGRGAGNLKFEQELENADRLVSDPADQTTYIASILQHYPFGLEKLKATHPHYFEKQSGKKDG